MGLNTKILDRYVAASVVLATVIALFILVSLDGFFAFIAEIDEIGNKQYDLSAAIVYVLLTLPRRAYEMFPMAMLLGSLVGLGSLSSNSELVVMRAVGISLARIVGSVLVTGAAIMVVMVLIGEVVAPASEKYAQSQREIARSNRITLQGSQGFWARDGQSFINIRTILGRTKLENIFIYEFDDHHQLKIATHAQSATFDGERWLLKDIKQSYISENGVFINHDANAAWDSLLDPSLLNVVVVKPENLSTLDLARYVYYMRENNLDANRYELAFWVRIAAPLSSLVMLLLSVPFVFGPLRSVGAGQRILVGVLIGVGFTLFNRMLNHMGQVYSFSPFWSAMLPTLLFLSIGVWSTRRVSRTGQM